MDRVRNLGSLLGLLAGAWALGGSYFDGISRACPSPCGHLTSPNLFVVALAVLLILNSAVSAVFPIKAVFYAGAGLAILLGASMIPNSDLNDFVVILALGLAAAAIVLSLIASRRRTRISEQSNPMNLPVFG